MSNVLVSLRIIFLPRICTHRKLIEKHWSGAARPHQQTDEHVRIEAHVEGKMRLDRSVKQLRVAQAQCVIGFECSTSSFEVVYGRPCIRTGCTAGKDVQNIGAFIADAKRCQSIAHSK